MGAWLWWAWLQVWPNLAANVLWMAPTFITHHVLLRRHIDRLHAEQAQHITASTSTTTEVQA